MALPGLYQTQKSHITISSFAGLNRNLYIEPNELADSLNMSVSEFPYIVPREKRSKYLDTNGNVLGHGVCNGIATKQGMLYAENDKLYYCQNGDNIFKYVGDGLMTAAQLSAINKEHQFVSLGAYVLIFPEKKFFWSVMFQHYNDATDEWFEKHNLQRSAYYGDMEFNLEFDSLTITQCDVYGDEFQFKGNASYSDLSGRTAQLTAWESNAVNGDIYLLRDSVENKSYVMQYNESYYGWVELTTTYVKLTVSGNYANKISAYEGLTIKNLPTSLSAFNGTILVQDISYDLLSNKTSFVFIGIVDPYNLSVTTQGDYDITYNNSNNSLTIAISEFYQEEPEKDFVFAREIPDMDYMCELDARLWGCSNENKEVYASALGNPFSFSSFAGTSQDSYVLTVGSDGDFTGCCAYLGYVLFFKENCIHRMYGTKPTNYQLSALNVKGVQRGCSKSLAIANDTLYYKSKDGILAYQGSMPENISLKLGSDEYKDAKAGIFKNRYYLSVFNCEKNCNELLVFNNATGLWIKEDGQAFTDSISTIDSMYFIDVSTKDIIAIGNAFEKIKVQRPSNNSLVETEYVRTEEDFEWRIESGYLNAGALEHKLVSKLLFEIELFKDTEVSIYLQYDNEDIWHRVSTKTYEQTETWSRVYHLPIIPRRCQRLRYKLEGNGRCVIKAIDITTEIGSELGG